MWAGLLLADIQVLRTQLDGVMGDDGRHFLELTSENVAVPDLAGVVGLHLERNAVDLEWHTFLSEWDVLLSPTWAQPAFAHGTDVASAAEALDVLVAMRPVLPANLLGLPAAVVPCGMSDELPVGAQLTARRFGDLTALAAAQALEDAFGLLTPIDPVRG